MSSKIRVQLYFTPEQKRVIKSRSAQLGKRSMGDYLWELVKQDVSIDDLREVAISENVK